MTDQNIAQWSGLRRDILDKIVKKLHSRIDVLHLRAVCFSWRLSIPLPPKTAISGMPLQLPFPICPNPNLNRKDRGYFTLKESTIYCIEPLTVISSPRDTSKSWFVHVEEELDSHKVRLRHPLSVVPVDNSSESLPRVLNLLDYRVSEVTKCYTLDFVSTGKNKNLFYFNEHIKCTRLNKVVVSEGDGDFTVMTIHSDPGSGVGGLGLWRRGDKKWTMVDCFEDIFPYEDIAYHNGKFYAVSVTGLAISVDPSSVEVTIVADPLQLLGISRHLVKSLNNLFLIEKHLEKKDIFDNDFSCGFEIYKLNEGQHKWTSLCSINYFQGQAFFVGEQCTFSVSAREFAGCKNNSIYFTDLCSGDHGVHYTESDIGLFDIVEDKTQTLRSDPCYAKIFWPPPTWLVKKMYRGTTHSTINWCTLQKDALEEISNRLNSRIDVLRLRAVCTTWRSVVPLPLRTHIPGMPLKLPFPVFNNSARSKSRGHFDLKESTIYCIEPLTKITNSWNTTKSWFIRVEEVEFGKVCLRHPLSRFPVVGLHGEMLNLFEYRVVEVSKAYNLEFVGASNTFITTFNELKATHVKKIAVSPKNEEDFAIMVLDIHGTLGLWKMGYNRWSKIDLSHKELHFDDIAYYKGRFYAVDYKAMTIAIDSSSLKVSKVTSPMRNFDGNQYGDQFKCLVESLGKLLMVVKFLEYDCCECDDVYPIRFIVYTLNEEKSKWELGGDLKEKALFLGDDCSFSVSARDFAGCKGNSVYFVDDIFDDGDGVDYPGKAVGLFDLEDETAQALPTVICYSKIFWPPPTWIKRSSC